MDTKLQQYFPMIRTKEEIMTDIQKHPDLKTLFGSWTEEQQTDFLNFCSGAKGVKMLYDSFFKEIMNPDTVPERLEELLSLLLGQDIHILKILPNESVNITDNKPLLIMDIVVEMTDGSIANIEVQKIGYAFPGQRCACYSADLLLRQYKRVKQHAKKHKNHFSYRDIKKVYTIVFFEKSTQEFHACPDVYIHRAKQRTDTGLDVDFLQEFVLIPLDIFKKSHHNRGISDKLEAWLTFLSMDDPESIVRLISTYPEFKELYEDIYTLCLDIERVMGMYSKELLELDLGTIDYMIDEMQNTIDAQKDQIDSQKQQIDSQ
ncbi:MAG: PD-(D/E)XK nuclease family transposase, partial [Coprococcus sp.]